MIFVNSMSDLFHEDVPFDFIDDIFETMIRCERHTFQILTKRPERMYEYFDSTNSRIDMIRNHILKGVSVENQQTADERIKILQTIPGKSFLSCEPLLSEITFREDGYWQLYLIDWVIVGGESGPGYRPMNLDWARSIRDQCASAGIPFFFKQTAGKKQIPEDLKVREFPELF